jgi:hypothetical protein
MTRGVTVGKANVQSNAVHCPREVLIYLFEPTHEVQKPSSVGSVDVVVLEETVGLMNGAVLAKKIVGLMDVTWGERIDLSVASVLFPFLPILS